MKNDRSKNIDEVATEPKQTRFIPVRNGMSFMSGLQSVECAT